MAIAPGVGYDIVVVGTSWGGLAALRTLVAGLPRFIPDGRDARAAPHKDSDHLLRTLLQERSTLRVCEVEDKMPLEHGHVYVAPPNYHMLVEPGYFSLTTDAPVRFSRPSIDVTFASAADSYGASHGGRSCSPARTTTAREGCAGSPTAAGCAIVQDPDDGGEPADAGRRRGRRCRGRA